MELDFTKDDEAYIQNLATLRGMNVKDFILEIVRFYCDPEGEKKNKRNFGQEAKDVLEFLNRRAGKKFKPVDANLSLIKARLRESTTDDLKAVIALKVRKWKGTEQEEYLRPATLFNATKFAQYQGELG